MTEKIPLIIRVTMKDGNICAGFWIDYNNVEIVLSLNHNSAWGTSIYFKKEDIATIEMLHPYNEIQEVENDTI